MKNRTTAFLFVVVPSIAAFFGGVMTGCATTDRAASPVSQANIELAIGVASDAAALVLQKNPKAVPALRATSAGIGTVLTQSTLTPEEVKAFVDRLGQDADLSPAERLVIGRAVQRVHGILIAYFATPDLNIADPRVRAALEKVRRSIDDTLALYDVLRQASARVDVVPVVTGVMNSDGVYRPAAASNAVLGASDLPHRF